MANRPRHIEESYEMDPMVQAFSSLSQTTIRVIAVKDLILWLVPFSTSTIKELIIKFVYRKVS